MFNTIILCLNENIKINIGYQIAKPSFSLEVLAATLCFGNFKQIKRLNFGKPTFTLILSFRETKRKCRLLTKRIEPEHFDKQSISNRTCLKINVQCRFALSL